MSTVSIILGIVTVFIMGFIHVYKRHLAIVHKIKFAGEYRNKYVEFANKYVQTYDRWSRSGNFDQELYVWLTMNSSKIQNQVGTFGVISFRPAFQNYVINNYQIFINTIPMFRERKVDNSEIGAIDDCLLRYIGYAEEYSKQTTKNLRNPIVWFREGFRDLLILPILILSWFGIITDRTFNSLKDSFAYKIISGIIALVTLLSGIVTIIIGYKPTIEFLKELYKR